MADDAHSTGFSLRRWSQRKLAARRSDGAHEDVAAPKDPHPPAMASPAPAPGVPRDASASEGLAAAVGTQRPAVASPVQGAPSAAATTDAIPLPTLESLTIDSDFSPFMQAGVDEDLKRSALRKLLRHPRFNVMDGLDVYIDDYSKPSPLEPELVRTLAQARYIFNPPKTRVTADGIVEDVPDDVEPGGDKVAEAAVFVPAPAPTGPGPEAGTAAPAAPRDVEAPVAPMSSVDATTDDAVPMSPVDARADPISATTGPEVNDPGATHGVLQ